MRAGGAFTCTQTDGAEPTVHAHYLYDAGGARVKKLVRKQGGDVEVTHYVDGVLEHHRWRNPQGTGQNSQLHVMDGAQRVAMVRTGMASPGDRGPAVQFTLADHLGSSNVVVDAVGALVDREEFTPYGESSFGSFARPHLRPRRSTSMSLPIGNLNDGDQIATIARVAREEVGESAAADEEPPAESPPA